MKRISTPVGVVIILAAAVVLVGGAFYIMQNANIKNQNDNTKSQNETTDWKTYKNDEYGFEIKYPSSFSKLDYKGVSNEWMVELTEQQRQFYIRTTSDKEFVCHNNTWAGDVPNISLNDTIFTGVAAGLKDEPYDSVEYCGIRNGVTYQLTTKIVYVPETHNFAQQDMILNKMLSTFKFTR